ncbi:4'-phosphopantetheinyl transferase superfamily protein [Nocardia stercoris]|uniref:4'-phosphopantetheinyl transferase superfamily protein n=1 Tax=Nocardia stercoris TaxID=2483361 RepID=A0A3M2KYB6_9NOCA|nr:4'-phosphopantetheinyl transferase superfamily protein [Nocardia stercoris]RMI29440.1 4'-phosphopantetheinyl transferase superfamily protein [Nocardia stercoris]
MSTTAVLVVTAAAPVTAADLSAGERDQFAGLPTAARRREFLHSRRALKLAAACAGLGSDTAALSFPHRRLSLSHSGIRSAAALTVGATDRIAGVGIDLEAPRAVDPRTARFFLRPGELDAATDPAAHLRLWTIKEALFKADPANAGALLTDYRLDDPAAPTGTAHKPGSPGLRFCYRSDFRAGLYTTVAVALAATEPALATVHPRRNTVMLPEITFDDVAERIHQLLPIVPGTLTEQTKVRDLVGDSFALVEMIIDVQEEFDVIFTQSQLGTVQTLGDLVTLLQSERAGGDSAAASGSAAPEPDSVAAQDDSAQESAVTGAAEC